MTDRPSHPQAVAEPQIPEDLKKDYAVAQRDPDGGGWHSEFVIELIERIARLEDTK